MTNRIEEIKSKHANWRKEWEASRGCADMEDFSEEVSYLLAKLEQGEKALEVAEKHISGKAETFSEREKTPVLYQINEALKAIREE